MIVIKLSKIYFDSEFEIEVKNLDNVEIKIYSSNSRYAGLGNIYDVTIYTDDNKYYLGNIGEISGGLAEFFVEQLYKQNIDADIIVEKTNNQNEELYKLILREFKPKIIKIKKQLELLESSKTDLRFKKISSVTNDVITVEYYGHKVGGSYVYDYEVVPSYISTLEHETNCKVEWTKERKSVGFGSDIYTFKVFINKIINKKRVNEIILGKRFHIDSTNSGGRQSPYAFRVSPGVEWAMMYSISENINENKEMPNVIIKKGRIVNIYGIDVFKIIIDAWEKYDSRPNSLRTHFKGTFDLIIPENDFVELYLKLYGELNNCHAELFYSRVSSPMLLITDVSFEHKNVIEEKNESTKDHNQELDDEPGITSNPLLIENDLKLVNIGYLPISIDIPINTNIPISTNIQKERLSKEQKEKLRKKDN